MSGGLACGGGAGAAAVTLAVAALGIGISTAAVVGVGDTTAARVAGGGASGFVVAGTFHLAVGGGRIAAAVGADGGAAVALSRGDGAARSVGGTVVVGADDASVAGVAGSAAAVALSRGDVGTTVVALSCVDVGAAAVALSRVIVVGNCPHRTLDMGWNRFLNMVKAEMEEEKITWKTMGTPRNMRVIKGGRLVKVQTNELVKAYDEDTDVFMYDRGYYKDITYYRSKYSHDNNIEAAFKEKYVIEIPKPEPEPTPTPEPTPEPTQKFIRTK